MFQSVNDLKTIDNDLTPLNEVRILDKNGRLIKTIIAKRIEFESPYIKNAKLANKKRRMVKKIKASDLIEIEK